MCGIVGIFNIKSQSQELRNKALRMAQKIRHRGPDWSGIYVGGSAKPQQCLNCSYEFACHGECPKNRFMLSKDGEPGLNYLCKGYYQFFDHVAPYMDFMKKEYLAERAPANVMEWARERRNK